MSDKVKVKVLRMHFGDHGQKLEGDTYETDRAHAAQLKTLNLVSIVETERKAESAPANKAEQVPENKASPSTVPATEPAQATTEPVTTPPPAEPVQTTEPAPPKPARRQRASKAKAAK